MKQSKGKAGMARVMNRVRANGNKASDFDALEYEFFRQYAELVEHKANKRQRHPRGVMRGERARRIPSASAN